MYVCALGMNACAYFKGCQDAHGCSHVNAACLEPSYLCPTCLSAHMHAQNKKQLPPAGRAPASMASAAGVMGPSRLPAGTSWLSTGSHGITSKRGISSSLS